MNHPPKLAVDNTHALPGKRGRTSANEPPGSDEMELRVSRLEEAFLRVDANLDRMSTDMSAIKASQERFEQRLGGVEASQTRMEERLAVIGSDLGAVKVSQARVEERMERVMDHARNMPSPDKVDSMINSKLGIAALLFAGLGALIAAITYAAS